MNTIAHRAALTASIALGGAVAAATVAEAARPQSIASVAPRIPCVAHMSNQRPHQRATVYVLVASWGGAAVTTTARYKTTQTIKHAMTNRQSGHVAIAYRISTATVGYRVAVDVIVRKGRTSGACETSFIPQA